MPKGVVDDGRLAKQAFVDRQRGFVADDAGLALETFQHRGFLAADIGACAEVEFDIERESAALDIVAEPAMLPGPCQSLLEHATTDRVFRTQIDIAPVRADR